MHSQRYVEVYQRRAGGATHSVAGECCTVCARGILGDMSLLRSEPDTEHLVLDAVFRGVAAVAIFVFAGFALGALWGSISGEMTDHIEQGLMIGAGFGGIAGVIAALMGVPNQDSSADV